MSYDLNDAQPQMAPIGELIPDGTFAKVRLTIRPGGVNGATPADAGLLKASQSSDARMLDCEFTVVDGPHARRKFWQSFTVAGGKLDDVFLSREQKFEARLARAARAREIMRGASADRLRTYDSLRLHREGGVLEKAGGFALHIGMH